MSNSTITRTDASHLKEPIIPSKRAETQAFSMARHSPLALDASATAASIDNLNQLLADTLTLRDLYKAPLAGFGAKLLQHASALRQAL